MEKDISDLQCIAMQLQGLKEEESRLLLKREDIIIGLLTKLTQAGLQVPGTSAGDNLMALLSWNITQEAYPQGSQQVSCIGPSDGTWSSPANAFTPPRSDGWIPLQTGEQSLTSGAWPVQEAPSPQPPLRSLKEQIAYLQQSDVEAVLVIKEPIDPASCTLQLSEPLLLTYFQNFGEVKSVSIHQRSIAKNEYLKHKTQGLAPIPEPTRLGFVVMATRDAAQSVLDTGADHLIGSACFRVERFRSIKRRPFSGYGFMDFDHFCLTRPVQ